MGLTVIESLKAERCRDRAAPSAPRSTRTLHRSTPGAPPRGIRGGLAPVTVAQDDDLAQVPAGHDFSRIPLSAGPPSPAQPQATLGALLASQEHDAAPVADEVTDEVLRSPGRALDDVPRAQMEARFGHDFSQVRVHADARAAASARAVGARAYTIGQDVVFANGAYAPRTPVGAHLLAHELAHVVQQRESGRLLVQRAPAGDAPAKAPPPTASPPKAPPAQTPAAKSKVKRLTVTKKGDGFDDFEAKRGGGTALGYHHGSQGDTFFANFRFQAQVDVEGDINSCKYEQTLDKTTSFGNSSGDDTYDELKQRPLTTKEWVKVSGSSVLWIDAPGTSGHKKPELPYSFKGKFTQSATGGDGERVGVAWNVEYKLGTDEKWEKTTDGLDKSANHS